MQEWGKTTKEKSQKFAEQGSLLWERSSSWREADSMSPQLSLTCKCPWTLSSLSFQSTLAESACWVSFLTRLTIANTSTVFIIQNHVVRRWMASRVIEKASTKSSLLCSVLFYARWEIVQEDGRKSILFPILKKKQFLIYRIVVSCVIQTGCEEIWNIIQPNF